MREASSLPETTGMGLEARMNPELERVLVERLESNLLCPFTVSRSKRILCSRRALETALERIIQEAFDIGYQRARKDLFDSAASISCSHRPPAWMEIKLADVEDLAARQVRIDQPTLKSLLAAGYRCLSDLRWVSEIELLQLPYIGRKRAGRIVAMVRDLDERPETLVTSL